MKFEFEIGKKEAKLISLSFIMAIGLTVAAQSAIQGHPVEEIAVNQDLDMQGYGLENVDSINGTKVEDLESSGGFGDPKVITQSWSFPPYNDLRYRYEEVDSGIILAATIKEDGLGDSSTECSRSFNVIADYEDGSTKTFGSTAGEADAMTFSSDSRVTGINLTANKWSSDDDLCDARVDFRVYYLE